MADEGGGNDALNSVLFVIYILLFLIAVWFLTGGPKRANVRSIFLSPPAPFGTSTFIGLPGVSFGDSTPGVGGFDQGTGYGGYSTPLTDSDRELFGLTNMPASPYAGLVKLESGSRSYSRVPNEEYVVIRYSSRAQGKLVITGWKLQSALNKRTAVIYQGAELYAPRIGEPTGVIVLSPGDAALVVSGRSPIGVSFKTNKCTGYLAQFQEFSPQLSTECPAALDEARDADIGGSSHDQDCVSFLGTIGQCRIATNLPAGLPDSCNSFVQNTLTYSSCVDKHIHDADFLKPEWRIFLNYSEGLWRSEREVLTLLDQDGKLVDAILF